MGVVYVVVALDAEVAAWLDREAIDHPPACPTARGPSPLEVFDALDSLHGLRTHVTRHPGEGRIDIEVADARDGQGTSVWLSECLSDDQPCQLGFCKGSEELIGSIVDAVSSVCGPLVLVPDTGEDPSVFPVSSAPPSWHG
jgi:hypothetical protein